MEVIRTVAELRAWRNDAGVAHRVGFVPTMGYLHPGHLSLIERAREIVPAGAGSVVLSIFVNPTQFGPNEDLDRYPRDEQGDLAKAEAAGVDVAFCPLDPFELYPTRLTWVDVEELSAGLCGASRPQHFRGVCTVVTKLWGLIRPEFGVFGEKDYQQLAILRRLHTDLFLGGRIVSAPIVREADGLAMSSRNANLSVDDRQAALAIHRYLSGVAQRFAAGERRRSGLLLDAAAALEPGRLDYVDLVDADRLSRLAVVEAPAVVAVAAHFGGVRLIDNVRLTPSVGT